MGCLLRMKAVLGVVSLMMVFQYSCTVGGRLEKKKENLDQLYEELQKIPPPIESARKLMKYFLDRDPDKVRRFKRQTFLRPTQYDVTYVIDSSSSVNEPQFNMGMRALAMMVDRARRNTKYAAVTIATRSRLVFNFTDLFTAKEKLSKLRRTGGKTNTQEALQLCYELFTNPSSGVRVESFKRILVVTDGQSNIKRNLTLEKAFQLKHLGLEIFVVAVGGYLDGLQELVGIASSTDAHMYRVADMQGFADLVKLIPPTDSPWINNLLPGGGRGEPDTGPLP